MPPFCNRLFFSVAGRVAIRMIPKISITARNTRQRGFALTELLFAVGIIAVVLGGISSVIATQLSAQKAKKEGAIIQSAVDDLKTIFSPRDSFVGVDMVLTTDIDLWPTDRVSGPGVVASIWGSTLNAVVDVAIDPTGKLLRIDIPDVPSKGCADQAAYPFAASRITINGQVVLNTTSTGAQVNPLDVTQVAAQCSADSDFSIWFSKDYF